MRVLTKTMDAASSASWWYFWQRIIDIMAEGCAARMSTIPRSMPSSPRSEVMMNAKVNPPRILRSEAPTVVLKEVIFIFVRL